MRVQVNTALKSLHKQFIIISPSPIRSIRSVSKISHRASAEQPAGQGGRDHLVTLTAHISVIKDLQTRILTRLLLIAAH